jgi:hypothetical protein
MRVADRLATAVLFVAVASAGILPAPASGTSSRDQQTALSRFDLHYVTMARKSCNDSHVGVIQQPDYCVRCRTPWVLGFSHKVGRRDCTGDVGVTISSEDLT